MENVYSKLGKLLKEWRESQGFSLYKVAKEGSGKARYDYLKRLENGEGVNASTMTCYFDFCYEHGFRALEILYAKEDNVRNEADEKQQGKDVAETTVEEEEKVSSSTREEVSSESLKELIKDAINYHAKTKVKMSAEKQLSILKLGMCPNCGSRIKQCNGSNGLFVGCSKFPNCRYGANGTLENPSINNMHREGFIPLGEKK